LFDSLCIVKNILTTSNSFT